MRAVLFLLLLLGATVSVAGTAVAVCTDYVDTNRPYDVESFVCLLDVRSEADPPTYERVHHTLAHTFVYFADAYGTYYASWETNVYQEATTACWAEPCATHDETWLSSSMSLGTPVTSQVSAELAASQFQASGPYQALGEQARATVWAEGFYVYLFYWQQGTPYTGCSEAAFLQSNLVGPRQELGPQECLVPHPFVPRLPAL